MRFMMTGCSGSRDERTMTLGTLLAALNRLTDIEWPDLNATADEEVVIRIDLGPDQDFEVRSVSVEDRAGCDEDPIVVIEAGLAWSPPAPSEPDRLSTPDE